MTKQKNIALIAWGHSLAHIVRLIEIIDSLKKISANQTLKLSVIGAGKYLENNNILDQTIYNLIKIDQKISPTHQAENIRAGKFDFYNSASELNEMVQSYIYAFRSLKDEDVYIVDNPDQACIVAIDVLIGLGEMDASKIVYLTNINWTLYRGMPFRVPSNHFAGEIFKNIAYKIGGEKAEKRIENFINSYIVTLWAPIQLKMGTKNPNKVFKKLIEEESGKRTTLKKYNDLRETINGTQGLILFADLELFDPPSSKGLPENAKYIGPLPYNYPGEIPQQLNEKISNARVQGKKIVYLTMGSTGDNVVINSIIKFFESETKGNYFLIFNHGNQEDVDYNHFSSVNPLVSDKMFITDFLPGEKIIPLTDMVIFHGGSTTFWQVVSAGINSLDNKKNKVPGLIVISTHIDQEDIGRHVENHQLGAHFTAKHIKRFVTENSLLLKMEEVLNESITFENNFRLLCQKLKEGGYNPNNVGAAAAAIIHQKYLINND